MKLLITGATGLVGKRLVELLFLNGFSEINVLSRNKHVAEQNSPLPIKGYNWNPAQNQIEMEAFEGVEAVIHLAGENVAGGRWSKARKKAILESRVDGTKLLIDSIKTLQSPPKKFISSAAIGIYGDRADEILDEQSSHKDDFLAEVCKKWEELALNHNIAGMKSHCLRTGIVLSNQGGALEKMLPPFKAGVAGILGNGKQFMSWIHVDDLCGQFMFLLNSNRQHDVYNAVSPTPMTNKEFTKTLGKVLWRPTLFPLPAFMLKLIFGEMSSILTASQRVLPKRLEEEGYQFKFTQLKDALEDLLRHDNNGEEVLQKYQLINKDIGEVFEFFSNEKNLEKITPPHLNFKVLRKSTDKIEEGTIIDYELKLHGFPLRWQSKINSFEENKVFVDEQLKGPYSKWHHTHAFIPVKDGTLVSDRVIYKAPLGLLGRLLSGPFIKKDLRTIFNYRKEVLGDLLS